MSDTIQNELPITLDKFISTIGISDSTAWRWRRDNILRTENIYGRLYVMPKDLRDFTRRMEAGEFAKAHKAPRREKALVE